MKTITKIVLIITDTITFGFGTGNLVAGLIKESKKDLAGIGAFLIVFGLLIHYWRKNYFQSSAKSETENTPQKDEKTTKNLITGIIAIIVFTFLAYSINKLNNNYFFH
jgi:hypothetical protein